MGYFYSVLAALFYALAASAPWPWGRGVAIFFAVCVTFSWLGRITTAFAEKFGVVR